MGLLVDLDAFYLEHRRCGELDTDVEQEHVWMTCSCGAVLPRHLRGRPLVRGAWSHPPQLPGVVRHTEGIEERLEAVVDVAPVDDRARSSTTEEQDVKRARELMGAADERHKVEPAQFDEKE